MQPKGKIVIFEYKAIRPIHPIIASCTSSN
jgi:hypothetical protein